MSGDPFRFSRFHSPLKSFGQSVAVATRSTSKPIWLEVPRLPRGWERFCRSGLSECEPLCRKAANFLPWANRALYLPLTFPFYPTKFIQVVFQWITFYDWLCFTTIVGRAYFRLTRGRRDYDITEIDITESDVAEFDITENDITESDIMETNITWIGKLL